MGSGGGSGVVASQLWGHVLCPHLSWLLRFLASYLLRPWTRKAFDMC